MLESFEWNGIGKFPEYIGNFSNCAEAHIPVDGFYVEFRPTNKDNDRLPSSNPNKAHTGNFRVTDEKT